MCCEYCWQNVSCWFYMLLPCPTIWLAVRVSLVQTSQSAPMKKMLDFGVVNVLKCSFEFILCPHKIGTIVTSHASSIASSDDHSSKCHYKWVCYYCSHKFNVNCPADWKCKQGSTSLQFISSFFHKKWSKEVNTTISEQWCFIDRICGEVSHDLFTKLSLHTSAPNAVEYHTMNKSIAVNNPITSSPYFLHCCTSATMCYSVMIIFCNQCWCWSCFWQNDWVNLF